MDKRRARIRKGQAFENGYLFVVNWYIPTQQSLETRPIQKIKAKLIAALCYPVPLLPTLTIRTNPNPQNILPLLLLFFHISLYFSSPIIAISDLKPETYYFCPNCQNNVSKWFLIISDPSLHQQINNSPTPMSQTHHHHEQHHPVESIEVRIEESPALPEQRPHEVLVQTVPQETEEFYQSPEEVRLVDEAIIVQEDFRLAEQETTVSEERTREQSEVWLITDQPIEIKATPEDMPALEMMTPPDLMANMVEEKRQEEITMHHANKEAKTHHHKATESQLEEERQQIAQEASNTQLIFDRNEILRMQAQIQRERLEQQMRLLPPEERVDRHKEEDLHTKRADEVTEISMHPPAVDLEMESEVYFSSFFEWKKGKATIENNVFHLPEKSIPLSELSKIKIFKETAIHESRKLKLSHFNNIVMFSVDPKQPFLGFPLQYYWFARITTLKLELNGNDLSNPYIPERNFTNVHVKNPIIHGIIYKQSQYRKSWQLRYVSICDEGLFSYKDEKSSDSFSIKKETATELWTRFDLHEKMLVIKVHHSGRKTEFAIPLTDYCIASDNNWMYAFYQLIYGRT